MHEQDRDPNCLFCKVVAGEIPASIVHSGDETVAFRDINPQAPTHILVVPRRHVPNAAAAAGQDVWEAVMGTATELALRENLGDSGYRLVANSGADAGQSVDHFHVHVLGGRRMAWPPG